MQVEDVTRVCLAARRATQQQRDGAVGLGLLGEVIEHDEDVLALVHPVLADGRTGVRGQPLESGRVRRRCRDNGGVFHRAGLVERGLDARDGRALLPDRDVDATHLLGRVTGFPVRLLVQDGVDADRGLAGLAVADDQLTLATADSGHRVDGLDAGRERLLDGLTLEHRCCLELQHALLVRFDLALTIDGLTQRVHHPAEELVADRDGQHVAGTADLLAFFDLVVCTEDDRTDLVLVEVEGHAQNPARELEQFVRHRARQAAHVGDTVRGVGDYADFFARCLGLE